MPNPPQQMLRINVIGTSGSGKSTFARKLATVLDYPLTELDRLFWNKDWQESSNEEFFARITRATEKENWILDGNYSRSESLKWQNVTTVIWIDFSFPRTVRQAFGRAIKRIRSNEEIWPGTGNTESFRRTFMSADSVLLWTLHTYFPNRRKIKKKIENPKFSHITFIGLRSPAECQKFLDQISNPSD